MAMLGAKAVDDVKADNSGVIDETVEIVTGGLAKEAAEAPQPDYTTLSVAKQNIDAKTVHKWHKQTRKPEYSGFRNLIKADEHKYVHPKAKQHWWLHNIGGAYKQTAGGGRTGHTELYARMTRLISGHMPIGEYRKDFKLEGRQTCTCGSPDTREHMLTNCPLWIRCWTAPQPPMPDEERLLDGLEPINVRSMTQPFGRKDLHWFLCMNPMAATFKWSDLCDKRDADKAEGLDHTYAIVRIKVETELKKKMFRAFSNKMNAKDDKQMLYLFQNEWKSGHEWTVRMLVHLNVLKAELPVEGDRYPNRLPSADPKKKQRLRKEGPEKNGELCRSLFADWVFKNLDQNLVFHVPAYKWGQRRKKRQYLNLSISRTGKRVRADALDFDSDSEDGEETQYVSLIPRVTQSPEPVAQRPPATPPRSAHTPQGLIDDDNGSSSSEVRADMPMSQKAPIGQRKRALLAKKNRGEYLFIDSAVPSQDDNGTLQGACDGPNLFSQPPGD
ncbi:hypothetical protein BDY19DRAFT_998565 [Irpex rosettiformis]|uniref:Uncharacterized protein n=1 Tax=Irpex rosettiformis TaxID=378272 RepID=A0ACB8TN99_9APHY|nr:hypothetical protein BDY19DRAFT_998565 [Irpex rosettiformis]